MRRLIGLSLLAAVCGWAQPVTIRASLALDGKGGTLKNVTITVEGGKIIKIEPTTRIRIDYDLSGFTVMPGWIDTHVHIGGHFNKAGRADTRNEPAGESALRGEGNAWATLLAGFTTVQSLGADSDKELRDLINEGLIPGPRILTSMNALTEKSGTPDEIRARIRKLHENGADVIKLFATASSRDGGAQTMTDAQIQAACEEAKSLGMRAAVHAHAAGGAKPAILFGCTSIEHGTFLTNEVLDLMVAKGVYLDTNLSNVPNYLNHKAAFLGLGNYTEKGFEEMKKDLPIRIDTLKRAMAHKVKIVFGTDAVAGLHGNNAEEFIIRVRDGGQPAMDAIVSATSRAAESLRMADKIGTLAVGMEADIIATSGSPLEDIGNVRKVAFVMKGGKIYRSSAVVR
jgi:imidazolonepropionase-like amidohydrolase